MKLRKGVMYMVFGAVIGLLLTVVWMFLMQSCVFTGCSWLSLCDFMNLTDQGAIRTASKLWWDVYYKYALLFSICFGFIGFIVGVLRRDDDDEEYSGVFVGFVALAGCVLAFLLFAFCSSCTSCLK